MSPNGPVFPSDVDLRRDLEKLLRDRTRLSTNDLDALVSSVVTLAQEYLSDTREEHRPEVQAVDAWYPNATERLREFAQFIESNPLGEAAHADAWSVEFTNERERLAGAVDDFRYRLSHFGDPAQRFGPPADGMGASVSVAGVVNATLGALTSTATGTVSWPGRAPTARLREIYDFICRFNELVAEVPPISLLARRFKVDRSTMREHLQGLFERKLIESPGVPRPRRR